MPIVQLSLQHEAALKAFLADFSQAGEKDIAAYFAEPDWSHARIVSTFRARSQGREVQPGFVPTTTSFLVEDGRILGISSVRHRLNASLERFGGHIGFTIRPSYRRKGYANQMLAEAVDRCRAMSIPRIIVTCDPTNIASARTILRNGGQLQETFYNEKYQRDVSLYWIIP